MKNIQLILIIAILILVYLISMQWLEKDVQIWKNGPQPEEKNVEIIPPVAQNIIVETPPTPPEVIIQEETQTPEMVPEKETATDQSEQETPEEIEKINPDLIEYKNTNYGYHLSLPKKMYYAGFWARNGAIHTLAIQEDALPENFSDASVRVFFYGKKVLPELQNTERYVDPNGKYILLLIDGMYSVRIEWDILKNPTITAIEETIGVD